MDPISLGLAGLTGGMSLLSGLGAQSSAKKQQARQMEEDRRMDNINRESFATDNRVRMALGRELLDVPETTTEHVEDNRWTSTRTASRGDIDMDSFMAAGAKAGFNPVTWLNAGGLSAYARTWGETDTQNGGAMTTTTTKRGHNAADAFKIMMPETFQGTPSQMQRIPSTMEAIGGAGTAALSMLNTSHNQSLSRDFQTSLLDRQLSALAQRSQGGSPVLPSVGGGVGRSGGTAGPAVTTSGLASLALNPQGFNVHMPDFTKWKVEPAQRTNPFYQWVVDPKWADTQSVEDYGGDVVGALYGVAKTTNDAVLNTTGVPIADGVENWWNGRRWDGGFLRSGPGVALRNYAQWGVYDRPGSYGGPGGSSAP